MRPQIFLALIALTLMAAQAAQAKHLKASPKPAPASAGSLSGQDKRHLLQDAFTVVKTVRETPEPVRKELIPDGSGVFSGIADPGQPYQTTDVVGPKKLPFRRLIFTATSQGYCLVYYEFGGFGFGQRVDLFRLSGGRATRAWFGNLTEARQPLTLSELRAAISRGKYHDMLY